MCTVHKQVISHGGVSIELPAAVHQTLSKSNNGGEKSHCCCLLAQIQPARAFISFTSFFPVPPRRLLSKQQLKE